MKKITFASALLLATSPVFAAPFESLSEDYAAKARILEALDKIVLTDVKIQNQALPDALDLLEKNVPAGSGQLPEVELFAGFSEDDPFADPGQPTSWKGITFEAASISYARAIDRLCRESGHQWLIEIDQEGKPVLQFGPKSAPEAAEPEDGEGLPNGEQPVDLKIATQRDILVSYWYMNMWRVVDSLERHTGHKFKTVAKTKAGPVEILEEQAAFMKAFLEETDRLRNGGNPEGGAKDR